MAEYFLVMEVPGPAWDHARPRREQDGWDEHATFVDGLSNEGVVVFGGPLGDPAFGPALLVFHAESEAEIRRRLADDPWKSNPPGFPKLRGRRTRAEVSIVRPARGRSAPPSHGHESASRAWNGATSPRSSS